MRFHAINPTKTAEIEPYISVFNEKMYREIRLFDAYDKEHPSYFDSQEAFILKRELRSHEDLPAEAIAGIGLIRYNSRPRLDTAPRLAAVRFRKADSEKTVPTSADMVNCFVIEFSRLETLELCASAVARAAQGHITGARQPLGFAQDALQDDAFVRDFMFNQR